MELSSKSLFLSLDKEKRLVLTFSMTCEIRNFHVVVCNDCKEMYQKIKLDGHAKLLFCYSKLIAFLLFSLPWLSLLKLPNDTLERKKYLRRDISAKSLGFHHSKVNSRLHSGRVTSGRSRDRRIASWMFVSSSQPSPLTEGRVLLISTAS